MLIYFKNVNSMIQDKIELISDQLLVLKDLAVSHYMVDF